MESRTVVVLSVAAGVLALGVVAGSIALAVQPTSSTSAHGLKSSPAASAEATPSARPTPTPGATSPADVLLDGANSSSSDLEADPPSDIPTPTPDVTPTPGPGEHVVTFSVTSSSGIAQVSYYTAGGDPSSSDSSKWIFGESQTDPTWEATTWTHSVIIPAGGDPTTDGWGLSFLVEAGAQASCRVTMGGTVISSASNNATGPTLIGCHPGIIG